jgi:hypothetical protein
MVQSTEHFDGGRRRSVEDREWERREHGPREVGVRRSWAGWTKGGESEEPIEGVVQFNEEAVAGVGGVVVEPRALFVDIQARLLMDDEVEGPARLRWGFLVCSRR